MIGHSRDKFVSFLIDKQYDNLSSIYVQPEKLYTFSPSLVGRKTYRERGEDANKT